MFQLPMISFHGILMKRQNRNGKISFWMLLYMPYCLRFDFNKEELPDVLGPKGSWYQRAMLKGNKDGNRLVYEDQRKSHREAFNKLKIFCSKATHAGRLMGANRMHDEGVDMDQISQLGGWSAIGALLK